MADGWSCLLGYWINRLLAVIGVCRVSMHVYGNINFVILSTGKSVIVSTGNLVGIGRGQLLLVVVRGLVVESCACLCWT